MQRGYIGIFQEVMSMQEYKKTFDVRWADLDPNFHMRHSAYNDYAAQVRLGYLSENGYTLERFRKENLGPVLFREETKFFKEILPGDVITVDFQVTMASEDGRKWQILHTIYRKDGVKAAEIVVDGAWMDTKLRKVVAAPKDLLAMMEALHR
jgi:acyl-CoA thioester hydrolase